LFRPSTYDGTGLSKILERYFGTPVGETPHISREIEEIGKYSNSALACIISQQPEI
jgi:hypothetical protein